MYISIPLRRPQTPSHLHLSCFEKRFVEHLSQSTLKRLLLQETELSIMIVHNLLL